MRELTKSMLSFSWAMSMLGLNQMGNLLAPQAAGRSAAALNSVTRATEEQLGPLARQTFRTGDNLQRQVTDAMFALLGAGFDPRRASGAAAPGASLGSAADQALNVGLDLLQQGVNVAYRMMGGGTGQPAGQSGWGPVPPPPEA